MRISKLLLVNWKNFKKTEVNLATRVFIIGSNASGKSNFLDAIRFLRDIVKQGGGLQEAALSLRDGVSSIRSGYANPNADITIGVVLSNEKNIPEWDYKLTFNQLTTENAGGQVIIKEEILKNLHTRKTLVSRHAKNKEKESEDNLGFTHIEQACLNEKFKSFVDFLLDISYMHLVPQFVRDPNAFSQTSTKEDYYGKYFMEDLLKMNKQKREIRIKEIEKILAIVLPGFEKLNFIKKRMEIPHLEILFNQQAHREIKYQESALSDGTLRLIGWLWVLLDKNKIALLEEPEMSLHSSIVRQLPNLIYQIQKNEIGARQTIITTHSFEMIDNKSITAEEILLVTTDCRDGSKVIPASSLPDIQSYITYGTPIANMLTAYIAPKNVEQLPLQFD
jgi:predicted ATPase